MSDEQGPLPITRRVQRACAPGLWSRGVKLAREGAVTLETRAPEEATLRVRAPGRPVAPAVTLVLLPGDEDWDCDCGGRAMPCEHIAAAAIALGQLGEAAAPAASEARAGRVVYRFRREEGGLSVERFLAREGGAEIPLQGTLAALLSAPAQARQLAPEEPDLRADQVLERRGRGLLPGDKLAALLAILAELPGAERPDNARLLLDDQPIAILREPLRPRARLFDRDDDVVLELAADPALVAAVATGVALCRGQPGGAPDTLRLLAETDLTGAWLQSLPRQEVFPRARLGELAARIVPDLFRRVTLSIESQRLPALARDEKPRIAFQVDRAADGLTVLPLLVYGDPPCARIDPSPDGQGRLVHLGGPVPLRDPAAERALRLRLHAELNLLPGRRSHLAGADAARLAERLQRWSAQLGQRDAAALRSRGTLRPALQVRALGAPGEGPPRAQAELAFALEADGVTHTVPAEAVLSAFREGLGLVPLADGFAALPADFLDKHADKIEALLHARRPDGAVAPHALPELAELCDVLGQPRPPALERLRPLAERFERIPAARLPAALTAELRPYQRAGVDWLHFLRDAGLGGVLADDMGLGKTLQALCVLDGRAGRRALVVCPTSVVGTWCAEAARFRPDLRVCEYQGPRRALDPGAHLTVTSYAILRQDSEALQAVRWDAAILDEAQAIKNPDSQTARAAYALQAELRLALSGTPVENRLDELWSLMHYCNPGLLGGRRSFGDGPAAAIAAGDLAAAARLRRRIKPFLLRRLKREVAPELPPRTEATLHVLLDEQERAVYDAVRAAARAEVARVLDRDGGQRPSLLAALEALLRLRQAACHPALVPGQTATGSSKLTALCEALESAAADGHKALVFSQWTSLLDLIEPALREAGLAWARLDGATKDRDAVIARFSAPDGPPVMLLSLKAGGTGLNLTAADHVFLCDPWWNPAAEAQAADRAHRIGQDRPVTIYRLVARDTVEERILALQEKKRALADAVVDGGAAAALTRDELLALLD